MKKLLLVLVIMFSGSQLFAQNGQDFPSFGDEVLSQKNRIEIYPNPSIDFLNVIIENSSLHNTEFVVHNIIGNRFTVTVEKLSDNEFRLDVRNLPAGYYLLAIKDDQSQFSKTFKFLKR